MTVEEALKVVDRRISSWMSVDAVTGVLSDEVRRLRQRVKHLEGMLGNSESMACYYNHQFMRIQQRVWELEAAAHELRDTVLNEHDGLEVNYVLDLIDSTIGEVIEPTKPPTE